MTKCIYNLKITVLCQKIDVFVLWVIFHDFAISPSLKHKKLCAMR